MQLGVIGRRFERKGGAQSNFRLKIPQHGARYTHGKRVKLSVFKRSAGVEANVLFFAQVHLSISAMHKSDGKSQQEETHEVDFAIQLTRCFRLQFSVRNPLLLVDRS